MDCFSPADASCTGPVTNPEAPFLFSGVHLCHGAKWVEQQWYTGKNCFFPCSALVLSNCTGVWPLVLAPLASHFIATAFWQKGGQKETSATCGQYPHH